MSMRRVEERGVAYAVSSVGDYRGVVLLLHSLGTDHRTWDHATVALNRAGFRVIAPDSRGHGASDDGPLHGAETWAEDLRAVLADDGVDAVHVVGVSMGCAQALELALAYPERVQSLVLSGGFGHLDEEVRREKASALSWGAESAGMAVWAERYTSDTLVTDDSRAHRLVAESVASVDLKTYCASAQACFAPRNGDLRDIQAPTLVVWGERDHKTPEEMSLGLVRDLPCARLVRLPGGGHLSPLDVPDEFADVVVTFLASATEIEATG